MDNMTLDEAIAASDGDTAVTNNIFLIDSESRTINVPPNGSILGVETDNGVERKYFKCPRIVGDNIDLSKHKIYVSYIKASNATGTTFVGEPDSYYCDDMAVDDTGDYITFSWCLSGNVLKAQGYIAYKVVAKHTDGDYSKTRWNTRPAIGTVYLTVPDGEPIEYKYPDIVTQLLDRMDAVEEIATVEAMQGYVDDYLGRNPVQLDSTLTDPEKAAPADIVGELRGDINKLNEGGLNLKDEVIAEDVSNWLNEHPEATTTVQDGVITEPKIHADFLPYIKKDYVTPQIFGAKGDGVTDDTESISNAINFCNTNKKPLYFPYGTYVVSEQLPKLNSGFVLCGDFGLNGSTVIKSSFDGYVLETDKNVCIRGIKFIGNYINTFGIKINGGWTSLIDSVRFDGFLTAMYLYSDDVFIKNCEIIQCGGVLNDNVYYALELPDGSNHKRVDTCHFEHCRYFIRFGTNDVAENYFYNCKFEQSTWGLNTDLSAPIVGGCYWVNPTNSFVNCSFGILYADAYIEGNSDITAYSQIPYFFETIGSYISNCYFYAVPGSGSSICLDEHKTGIKAFFVRGFSIVNDCTIISLLYIDGSIKISEQSYIETCRVYVSDKTFLESMPLNPIILRGKYAYNCKHGLFFLTNIYDSSNKIFTESSNYAPIGMYRTGYLADDLLTAKIRVGTISSYAYRFDIEVKQSEAENYSGKVTLTLVNENDSNTPTIKNIVYHSDNINMKPINVYYDHENREFIIQTGGTSYTQTIMNITGLESYSVIAYYDLSLKTASDKTLIGTLQG